MVKHSSQLDASGQQPHKRPGASFLVNNGDDEHAHLSSFRLLLMFARKRLWLIPVLVTLMTMIALGGGRVGYSVGNGVGYSMVARAVFRLKYRPQFHFAWLAPDTTTNGIFFVATAALHAVGFFMQTLEDQTLSGVWQPVPVIGWAINRIVAQSILYGFVPS